MSEKINIYLPLLIAVIPTLINGFVRCYEAKHSCKDVETYLRQQKEKKKVKDLKDKHRRYQRTVKSVCAEQKVKHIIDWYNVELFEKLENHLKDGKVTIKKGEDGNYWFNAGIADHFMNKPSDRILKKIKEENFSLKEFLEECWDEDYQVAQGLGYKE